MTDLYANVSDGSRIMNGDASPRRASPLRLAKSVKETASAHARKDGISLNHFINLAVAEKISRLKRDGRIPE